MSSRTKQVPPHVREHFAKELEAWVKKAHDGNQTKAGGDLGFTQGHLSAVIRGTRGPGLELVIALSERTKRSIDELLGLAAPQAEEMIDRLRRALETEVAQIKRESKGPRRGESSVRR